jgi:hypothetical protein
MKMQIIWKKVVTEWEWWIGMKMVGYVRDSGEEVRS